MICDLGLVFKHEITTYYIIYPALRIVKNVRPRIYSTYPLLIDR